MKKHVLSVSNTHFDICFHSHGPYQIRKVIYCSTYALPSSIRANREIKAAHQHRTTTLDMRIVELQMQVESVSTLETKVKELEDELMEVKKGHTHILERYCIERAECR